MQSLTSRINDKNKKVHRRPKKRRDFQKSSQQTDDHKRQIPTFTYLTQLSRLSSKLSIPGIMRLN